MCVCMYTCMWAYAYLCMSVYVQCVYATCLCVNATCLCVSVYVCVYCTCLRMSVCVCVCTQCLLRARYPRLSIPGLRNLLGWHTNYVS